MTRNDHDFFTVGLSDDRTVAVIDEFHGIESPHKMRKGVPMGAKFPSTVYATLKAQRGSRLTDFLHNNHKMIAISEKARRVFERAGLDETHVEYLPFVLHDKKGAPVEKPYCVAHPLRLVECMDRERSKFSTRKGTDLVNNVSSLQLTKGAIPPDALFFRLGEFPAVILFRSDFVKQIEDAGLTGLNLAPMGEQIW